MAAPGKRSGRIPLGPIAVSAIIVLIGGYALRRPPIVVGDAAGAFSDPPEPGVVRVLSWNLAEASTSGANWIERVGSVMNELSPGVVFLQDAPRRESAEGIAHVLSGGWRLATARQDKSGGGFVAVLVREDHGPVSRELHRVSGSRTGVVYRAVLDGGLPATFLSLRGSDSAAERQPTVESLSNRIDPSGKGLVVVSGYLHEYGSDCTRRGGAEDECARDLALRAIMLKRYTDCVGASRGAAAAPALYVSPKTVATLRSAVVSGASPGWTDGGAVVADLRP